MWTSPGSSLVATSTSSPLTEMAMYDAIMPLRMTVACPSRAWAWAWAWAWRTATKATTMSKNLTAINLPQAWTRSTTELAEGGSHDLHALSGTHCFRGSPGSPADSPSR